MVYYLKVKIGKIDGTSWSNWATKHDIGKHTADWVQRHCATSSFD